MTIIEGGVHAEAWGDGLVLTLQNGRVNAISNAVRRHLAARLEDVGDASFVVLRGRPGCFSAGAELSEIGADPGPPIRDLLHRIESLPCPVVAFVEGIALGGGFEIALACDYRVATARAEFGLPEVKLGLVPGAGGTVRLPRLVGVQAALSIIATGRTFGVEEAHSSGIVDLKLDESTALDELAHWLETTRPKRRAVDFSIRSTAIEDANVSNTVDTLRARAVNVAAFDSCVDLVCSNLVLSSDECERREAAAFSKLAASSESAAQRHLFAATSAVKRSNRRLSGKAAPANSVGVVGAGTMGLGIARAALQKGLRVTVIEPNALARRRAREMLAKADSKHPAKRGEQSLVELCTWGSEVAEVADCDVVVEAVFEDLQVKRDVFDELSRVTRCNSVLASNTSYLEIERIAEVCRNPERVLGLHFFSPAHVMKLVEVVRSELTGADALHTAIEFARRLDKVPVVVGSSRGFVGNRMLARRTAQADNLLLSGARPEQVDQVLTNFGFRMGPFEMADLAGLDVAWRNRQANGISAPAADRLVSEGRFGQKAGLGFYTYVNGKREVDNDVVAMMAEVARDLGIKRRDISDAEVLDRLLLPMIDEAAQIVREGVVDRSTDIDVIWANGYGWPPVRGGPIWWAQRRGIGSIVSRLDELADRTEDASLRASAALREWPKGP